MSRSSLLIATTPPPSNIAVDLPSKSNFLRFFVDLLIMVLCFFIFQNSLTSKAKKRHTQSDHFIITQLLLKKAFCPVQSNAPGLDAKGPARIRFTLPFVSE
uniref:Uncharacterized protein n=1 Tax=Klebsiella pneumoniae TaxID=573 RepID=A0A8B0SXU2_KLEPN|nr:hypothetical protein [Klebsiella pneumoniae]